MGDRSNEGRAFAFGALVSGIVCAIGLLGSAVSAAAGLYLVDPAADPVLSVAVAGIVSVVCGMIGGLAGRYGAARGRASSGLSAGLLGGVCLSLLPGSQAVLAAAEGDWPALLPLAALTVLGPVACAGGGWVGAGRGSSPANPLAP